MKTTTSDTFQKPQGSILSRSFGRQTKFAALLGVAFVAAAAASQAQVIWYLHANMAAGTSMTTPGFWYNDPVGGTAATGFSATDIYHSNGFTVRTNPSGITNFGGGTLITSGGTAGQLAIKGSGVVLNNFQTAVNGGGISNSEVNVSFSATTMTLNGNLAVANNGRSSGARLMTISSNTITGSGDITLAGGSLGFVTLSFGDATGFSGDIFSTDQGFIDFGSSFQTGGGLSMAVGTRVQDFTGFTITVNSLDVGGTVFAPGTYTYAQIKATNATTSAIFSPSGGGPMGGTIVVIPEPGTCMLLGLTGALFVGLGRKRSSRLELR